MDSNKKETELKIKTSKELEDEADKKSNIYDFPLDHHDILKNSPSDNIDNNENTIKGDRNDSRELVIHNSIDTLIDSLGISWYNIRIYSIISLFLLADGAEMIVISLILTKLGSKEVWALTDTQKGMIGSAVFVGFFVGALVSGKLADTKGRKPTFIIGSLIVCIFATFSALAPNFGVFIALRILNGFGIGMSVPSSTSLATEVTPKHLRAWVLNLVWVFFPFGEIFAVLLARALLPNQDGWRFLMGFAAIPSLIAFLISFFIFESPKFYMATKKYEKAFNGLDRMLNYKNKPGLTQEEKEQMIKHNEEGKKEEKSGNNNLEIKTEFRTLIKREYLWLTIKICVIFYICSFVYYGVVYVLPQTMEEVIKRNGQQLFDTNNKNNSIIPENIDDNEEMYRGLIFSALAEIPSTFITGYLANMVILGRKGSMGYGFIFTVLSAILCALFLNNLGIFASLLKFAINVPFGVIYIYVSEAYPTKIRSLAIGVSNSFTRLGGITTPLFSQLAFSFSLSLPFVLFSLVSIIGAIFSFILPFETLGKSIN
jgi:putative MFS transporter